MITHRCRLTTSLSITCLFTLFLFTLAPLSSAQQLTSANVPAAIKDLTDTDARVRADAARRLVLLGVKAKTASPALVEALKDPDSVVRHRSVMALQILWSLDQPGPELEAAVPALAALLNDNNKDIRVRAAYTLAGLGPDAKAAVPALTAINDQDELVRYAVRRALENIGKATVADIPTLVIELSDNNVQVRRRAAQRLESLGTNARQAIGPLLRALKDQDNRVRLLAVITLDNLIESQSDVGVFIAPFIDLLKDPDKGIRWWAASGLRKIGSRAWAAVPALTEALNDTDERVRKSAVYALESTGWDSESTTTALIKLLKDSTTDIRHAAARVLSRVEVGSNLALPVLIEDLKKNSEIRWSAMWALDSHGVQAKNAVPMLVDILNDPPYEHRAQAARLIGKVGPGAKNIVPLLLKCLNDREEAVRVAIAVALLQVEPGSESKIEPSLLKLAKAKIEKERERASSAYGGAPGPGIAPPPRWDEAGSYFHHGNSFYRQGNLDAAITSTP